MKKSLLALVLVSSLTLGACGNDAVIEPDVETPEVPEVVEPEVDVDVPVTPEVTPEPEPEESRFELDYIELFDNYTDFLDTLPLEYSEINGNIEVSFNEDNHEAIMDEVETFVVEGFKDIIADDSINVKEIYYMDNFDEVVIELSFIRELERDEKEIQDLYQVGLLVNFYRQMKHFGDAGEYKITTDSSDALEEESINDYVFPGEFTNIIDELERRANINTNNYFNMGDVEFQVFNYWNGLGGGVGKEIITIDLSITNNGSSDIVVTIYDFNLQTNVGNKYHCNIIAVDGEDYFTISGTVLSPGESYRGAIGFIIDRGETDGGFTVAYEPLTTPHEPVYLEVK